MFPADDNYKAGSLAHMYEKFSRTFGIIPASRFVESGCIAGAPFLKSILAQVASFAQNWLGSVPIKEASNRFRLFSRRMIDDIVIESELGFTQFP